MVNRLSISETNVLRSQLGLRLIPDTKDLNGTEQEDSSVQVSRISIEETNKLRTQLGLKLIEFTVVEDRHAVEIDNFIKREEQIKQSQKVDDLKKSIEVRKATIKRKKQMARGGILDREADTNNLEDWLAKIGKVGDQKSENTKDARSILVNVSKKLKFKTSKPKVDDSEVLTLKDCEVLDDNDGNDSNDELVNKERELDKAIQSTITEKKLNNGELVSDIHRDNRLLGTEDSKNQSNDCVNTKKRTFISIRLQSDDEDEDEDDVEAQNIDRDIAKPRFKKLKSKKTKKAKSRVINDNDIDFKPVSLIDQDNNKDDNEELDRLLAATRIEKTKQINAAETNEEKTIPLGRTIQENIQFLDTIGSLAQEYKQDLKSSSPSTTNNNEQTAKVENPQLSKRMTSILRNPQLDQSYSLSSVLSHLNEKADGNEKMDPNSIKITYSDDKGNELSTKEAYKFMSRKFHGTGKKKT